MNDFDGFFSSFANYILGRFVESLSVRRECLVLCPGSDEIIGLDTSQRPSGSSVKKGKLTIHLNTFLKISV